MARAWHPFYFGDYINDTRHMPMIEHGAYLLLMSHYYQQGYLPASAVQLHRICMAFAQAERDAITSILDQFFTEKDGYYYHERIEAELKKAKEISEKRSKAAKIKHALAAANAHASAVQLHTQSQSQSHKEQNPSQGQTPDESKYSEGDLKAAEYIRDRIMKLNPKMKPPRMDKWADVIRKMRERDDRNHREICELFAWCNDDDFWKSNILSPTKLRDKWDDLVIKKKHGTGRNTEATKMKMPAVDERLPIWAKENGHPPPREGELYPEYRIRLTRLIQEQK